MVIEVDLTKSNTKLDKKKIDEVEKDDIKIPKQSILKRLKNKIRIMQTNFAKVPFTRKLMIIGIGLVFTSLIAIAIVYGFILATTPEHNPLDTSFVLLDAQSTKSFNLVNDLTSPPAVKDQENPINGELYTKDDFEQLKERKPLMVILDNHIQSRPQAGLSQADLVYETLVESGLTRFMAVFWSKDIEKVGPIRSVRTYFLDWASEYDDPPIMNIGQAGYEPWEEVIVPEADARSYIIKYNMKSFDWYGRSVTWRDNEKNKSGIGWEHVAYSETETLWEDAQELGWIGPVNIEPLSFKKDDLKEKRGLSQNIEIKFINLSAETYKVKWEYNKDSNSYKRSLANKPHIDENNNKQVSAKNIILQYCQYHPTGDRNGRIYFDAIGSGDAKIFKDGKVVEGTWKKDSRTSRTKFFDLEEQEIQLNRGQIWIEVIPMSGGNTISDITIN